jgi:hypothetical protein
MKKKIKTFSLASQLSKILLDKKFKMLEKYSSCVG